MTTTPATTAPAAFDPDMTWTEYLDLDLLTAEYIDDSVAEVYVNGPDGGRYFVRVIEDEGMVRVILFDTHAQVCHGEAQLMNLTPKAVAATIAGMLV